MVQSIFDLFLHWLNKPGDGVYLLIFTISFLESSFLIGLLFPGTIFMLAIGVLASYGNLFMPLAIVVAAVGSFVSDFLSYMIGFVWGADIVDREKQYPFFRRHILTGKRFFREHGGKSVLVGKFFGPVRAVMPFIAGLCYMKRVPFLFYDAIGSISWSAVLIGLGFALHKSWEHVHKLTQWVGWTAFFVFIVGICLYALSRISKTLQE